MTIREFVRECELCKYSNAYYELIKEESELQLMQLYLAQQYYITERYIDCDTSYFMEAASEDIIQALTEAMELKKRGILRRVMDAIKTIFRNVIQFFKNLWKRITGKKEDINRVSDIVNDENTDWRPIAKKAIPAIAAVSGIGLISGGLMALAKSSAIDKYEGFGAYEKQLSELGYSNAEYMTLRGLIAVVVNPSYDTKYAVHTGEKIKVGLPVLNPDNISGVKEYLNGILNSIQSNSVANMNFEIDGKKYITPGLEIPVLTEDACKAMIDDLSSIMQSIETINMHIDSNPDNNVPIVGSTLFKDINEMAANTIKCYTAMYNAMVKTLDIMLLATGEDVPDMKFPDDVALIVYGSYKSSPAGFIFGRVDSSSFTGPRGIIRDENIPKIIRFIGEYGSLVSGFGKLPGLDQYFISLPKIRSDNSFTNVGFRIQMLSIVTNQQARIDRMLKTWTDPNRYAGILLNMMDITDRSNPYGYSITEKYAATVTTLGVQGILPGPITLLKNGCPNDCIYLNIRNYQRAVSDIEQSFPGTSKTLKLLDKHNNWYEWRP